SRREIRVPRRWRSLASGQKYSTTAHPLRLLGRLGVLLLVLLVVLLVVGGLRGRGGEHGLAHAGVGAATAEVAGQSVVDVLERGVGIVIEERARGHDEARSAEAALLGVVLYEGGLDRAERAGPAEALDRLNGCVLSGDRQDAAGVDGVAVEQNRAGAAGAAIADALGARQLELVAQGVEQSRARLQQEVHRLAVDPQPHRHRPRTPNLDSGLHPRRMCTLLRRLQHLPGQQPGAAQGARHRAAAEEITAGKPFRGPWRILALLIPGHSPPPSGARLPQAALTRSAPSAVR